MRTFHVGALICFLLAAAFYLLAWLPGAYGLGFIGIALELAAWIQVALRADDNPNS